MSTVQTQGRKAAQDAVTDLFRGRDSIGMSLGDFYLAAAAGEDSFTLEYVQLYFLGGLNRIFGSSVSTVLIVVSVLLVMAVAVEKAFNFIKSMYNTLSGLASSIGLDADDQKKADDASKLGADMAESLTWGLLPLWAAGIFKPLVADLKNTASGPNTTGRQSAVSPSASLPIASLTGSIPGFAGPVLAPSNVGGPVASGDPFRAALGDFLGGLATQVGGALGHAIGGWIDPTATTDADHVYEAGRQLGFSRKQVDDLREAFKLALAP